MASFTDIEGITEGHIELLKEAGIRHPAVLAQLGAEEARKRLELVAWRKGWQHRVPAPDVLESWCEAARSLPVPVETIPVAEVIVKREKIELDDIPEAVVQERPPLPQSNAYVAPSLRAQQEAAGTIPRGPDSPAPLVRSPEFGAGLPVGAVARSVDPKRFTTFEEYQTGRTRVEPLKRFPDDAPPEIVEAAPKRIEAERKLSRFTRRGVVHPRPYLLVFGAVVSLLWRVCMLFAAIALPWFLIKVPNPADHAGTVGMISGVMLVVGLMQFWVLGRARCRICSCHLFFSRRCVKNRKAHHIPLVGYTGSLALHLLLFQWFRCMYCGTAIRLWPGSRDREAQ